MGSRIKCLESKEGKTNEKSNIIDSITINLFQKVCLIDINILFILNLYDK